MPDAILLWVMPGCVGEAAAVEGLQFAPPASTMADDSELRPEPCRHREYLAAWAAA